MIICNVPESRNSDSYQKKIFDKSKIDTIILVSGDNASEYKAFLRIGKKVPSKARLTKLILKSKDLGLTLLKIFNPKNLQDSQDLSEVHLSSDKTPQEMAHLRELREELKNSTEAGESDLTIKYSNGTPTSVNAKM